MKKTLLIVLLVAGCGLRVNIHEPASPQTLAALPPAPAPHTYGAAAAPLLVTGTGLTGNASSLAPLDLIHCVVAGNVPTWNGTSWTCATPSAGGGVTTSDPLFGTTALTFAPTVDSPLAGIGSAGNHLRLTGTYVNSITAGTGGGLTISPTTGAVVASLLGCSSGLGLIDVSGTTWTCSTLLNNVGTNLAINTTSAGSTVSLNLPATTCSAGSGVTSITAQGAIGCTADVTSVVSGTGITASTVAGAATVTLNEAGASCGAGSAVTAMSATGVGTCNPFGNVTSNTLTANTIPKASGAGALTNSSITDDGTTTTFGATATTITDATGAMEVAGAITGAGNVFASAGQSWMSGTGWGCLENTNGTGSCLINHVGFNLGTTRSRDLHVQDGQSNDVIVVTGSTKFLEAFGAARFDSLVEVTGVASLDAGATVGGHVGYTGTAPAVSACGASPSILSGSTDMGGQITLGAATTTACTYTFHQTWAAKPFCTCSSAGSTSTEPLVSCDGSTTTLTINATSATTAGVFNYTCHGQSATIP